MSAEDSQRSGGGEGEEVGEWGATVRRRRGEEVPLRTVTVVVGVKDLGSL